MSIISIYLLTRLGYQVFECGSRPLLGVGVTSVCVYRNEAALTSGGDNAEGLNDSVLNDSQANTTMEGEITQDSVQMLVCYC